MQSPLNGSIIGNDTTFQKLITYQCDPGFQLRGAKTVICQSDGKWSQESTCEGDTMKKTERQLRQTRRPKASTIQYIIVYKTIRKRQQNIQTNTTLTTCNTD